jgi:hypothetical protein
MALADYFSKNALAAAQVLRGEDAETLATALNAHVIEVALSDNGASSEGKALLDLLVRLLARLYPAIQFRTIGNDADALAEELQRVALSINPRIDLARGAMPTVSIGIGLDPPTSTVPRIYGGSAEWDALFGTKEPQPTGTSTNPCGAGAAACLVAANLFRYVFLGKSAELDDRVEFSVVERSPRRTQRRLDLDRATLESPAVLVGCGGVGNAAAWALARAPIRGRIHLVDHDRLDLGNLQRTVLAARDDEGRHKVGALASAFTGRLIAVPHQMRFAQFVEEHGYDWDCMLVAVDSAADRRAIQASLPRWIVNAWTQAGDLGIGLHEFRNVAAPCLYCAYLPTGPAKNRDELVAAELGIPDRVPQVRDLLARDAAPPADLLDRVAQVKNITRTDLNRYADKPLRILYVEGICGGGVVSLATIGDAPQDLHVPLAHQSALAGVLLAGAFLADAAGFRGVLTAETRIDVMHSLGQHLERPVAKSPGPCICKDNDYLSRYAMKWPE